MTAAVDETGWKHTFDFRHMSGGFVRYLPDGYNSGTWIDGTGWILTTDHGGNVHNCDIVLNIPATTVTKAIMTYDLTIGTISFGGLTGAVVGSVTGYRYLLAGDLVSGTNQTLTDDVTRTNVTTIALYLVSDNGSPPPTGSGVIKSLVVTGIGPNPFLRHECCACVGNYAGIDCDEL
jgi:hypothetical protein